ncbi:unnamed protein product [Brassicogethes aeneus]|uniref:CUB domain-containing protein n=1 Tax=Brassicogethes aeneus TaxID=1431903 RepID=A0A9P0BAV9_BRAAE|nr:unnamed protein product [Brassicogethes aeneus]
MPKISSLKCTLDTLATYCNCILADYLKVFVHLEGGGEVSEYTPWESMLCGGLADVPTFLYSSGPGLVLEFHSGPQTGNATGFSGTFKFIDRRKFIVNNLPPAIYRQQFTASNL